MTGHVGEQPGTPVMGGPASSQVTMHTLGSQGSWAREDIVGGHGVARAGERGKQTIQAGAGWPT